MVSETQKSKRFDGENNRGLSDGEGELLYKLATAVPREHAIVQLGTGKPGSLVWLARGAEAVGRNKVHSINCFSQGKNLAAKEAAEAQEKFEGHLKESGVEEMVTTIFAPYEDAAWRWKEKVGLLCYDALCEYYAVKSSLMAWERHLSTNAHIVLCGYSEPGIARVAKEYLSDLGNFVLAKALGNLAVMTIDGCTHYWVIDSNEIGLCQHCGRKRNFNRMRRQANQIETRRRMVSRRIK